MLSQEIEGNTLTRQRVTPECSQGTEEGGAPPNKQRTIPVHDLREREREGGETPEQEGEGMAPHKQHSALPVKGTWEREGKAPPTRRKEKRR